MSMPIQVQMIQQQQAAAEAEARRAADAAAAGEEHSNYARAVTVAGGTHVDYSEHSYELGEITSKNGQPDQIFVLSGDFSRALGVVGTVRCGAIKHDYAGTRYAPLLGWQWSTGLSDPKDNIAIGPAGTSTVRHQYSSSVSGVRLGGPFGRHLVLQLWIAEDIVVSGNYYRRAMGACNNVLVRLGVQWAGEAPEIPSVGAHPWTLLV
jgi:hypothetical protein